MPPRPYKKAEDVLSRSALEILQLAVRAASKTKRLNKVTFSPKGSLFTKSEDRLPPVVVNMVRDELNLIRPLTLYVSTGIGRGNNRKGDKL